MIFEELVAELKQASVPPVAGQPPRAPHNGRPDWQLMQAAASAIETLGKPNDFGNYLSAQVKKEQAYAEYNAASLKLELSQLRMRCAELNSQHEPLAGLGVDREAVRQVLHYVLCGRLRG